MKPDDLRPILAACREQVAKAWSPATSHPDFDGAPGSPVGQCGVTSAWLLQRLKRDHDLTTDYFQGSVWDAGRIVAENHCWLETPDGLVIDLTAGQFGQEEVICDWWDCLGPRYFGRRVDPPVERVRILEEALS
jgi:hypothetical protein